MKIKIANYAFDKTAKTVTFSDYVSLNLDQVLLITNTTDNIIIYNFAVPALGGTMAANVLTLDYDTSAMDDTDKLQIFIEDNVGNTLGDKSDTSASSDTGSFSLIAFIKRALTNWTTLLSRMPAKVTEIPADDVDSDAIPVRALPMRVSRIGFTKTLSNTVDSDWGSVLITGTGMTVNQSSGNLVITAGTTARAETIIRSLDSWKGGVRLRCRSILSQRIVNNNFFCELVDVIGDGLSYTISSATAMTVTIPSNPFSAENVGQSVYIGAFAGTGTFLSGRYAIASVSGNDVTFTVSGFAAGSGTCSVFGWNYYHLLYDSTTATNLKFDTQRKGWNSGDTTATISTTNSPGHLAVVTGNDLSATLSDQTVASSLTIAQTIRATRVENVPDDVSLRLQIRVANGSTAPASGTTWTIGMVSVSNFANQDVVLQDVRPMTNAQALPVEILRSTSLTVGGATLAASTNLAADFGMQYRANATGAATISKVNSTASTNAGVVKAGAGRVVGYELQNTTASVQYVKLHNQTTAPTVGSTAVALVIPVPANGKSEFNIEAGIGFSTGISISIVTGAADTDATATTANSVVGAIFYA